MHDFPILRDLVILVAAAIPVVIAAHRLRVPSVVAFLLTGIAIGPQGLTDRAPGLGGRPRGTRGPPPPVHHRPRAVALARGAPRPAGPSGRWGPAGGYGRRRFGPGRRHPDCGPS